MVHISQRRESEETLHQLCPCHMNIRILEAPYNHCHRTLHEVCRLVPNLFRRRGNEAFGPFKSVQNRQPQTRKQINQFRPFSSQSQNRFQPSLRRYFHRKTHKSFPTIIPRLVTFSLLRLPCRNPPQNAIEERRIRL